MNRVYKYKWLLIASVIIVTVYGFKSSLSVNRVPGELDSFARCLKDSGAKLYGATWCSHCQNQKQIFGKSLKLVPYVECAMPSGGTSPICKNAGVESYPTWIFGGGARESGVVSISDLAKKTGCKK